MVQTLRLKRFTNISVLKRIDVDLLLRFLEPYRAFFVDQRQMTWPPENSCELDYDALTDILMSPGADTPEPLLDALYFLDSLSGGGGASGGGGYDRMLYEAEQAGIDLGTEDLTPEDLALTIWLTDPNILERIHAEQYRVRAKTFQSYYSQYIHPMDDIELDDETRQALESELNQWFEFKKKGRGARVFPFIRDDGYWFLVRHGQRVKREATVEADGQSGSVFYRPEKFDVVIYHPDTGELEVYASTKGEQGIYCQQFGKHLFGDEGYFQFQEAIQKYTLQPLVDDGRSALICSDVEGIEQVRLYELHLQHLRAQKDIEIRRADDVFAALADQRRDLTFEQHSVRLLSAKFKITFADGRVRGITLTLPNTASYDREADQTVINDWLMKRGFITAQTKENQEDVGVDPVLDVA